MGQIVVLDPLVAQQVAAGEVVDRPASFAPRVCCIFIRAYYVLWSAFDAGEV